ncbi:NAD-dependent succinate-semialdehyde dehydrogenase [Acidihalobacter prosperus]|uniref:Succinate-semialdehyde dehydrogenase n=1 Tax=Acidihalobacter prosperus TaxID=160660 RepID=A0A1A6C1Q0_9GAMM|nr:NAD-dependent succinate-semialdehyde dehydrogenase [Acidihalobacter prosperus]OBS08475.1 succinate-semialdehyde dehydrogenase [Acidihalobacter prosperus]
MPFRSINPATGETVATHDAMSGAQIDDALNRAVAAQREWAAMPMSERARHMHALSDHLLAGKAEFAALMSREMGKLYAQGIAEIEKCAWVCRFYADQAEAFLAPDPIETEAYRSYVNFRPLGVVLAIMPWNYPFWQVLRFAAPALMAGNGAVLKHAPNVFGCSLAIEALFREAGFPEHLFRSLLVDIPETTAAIHDPRIAAVSITSSVRAGRAVAAEAGRALKKCVLELGGSDPFIVLEDADLARAVEVGITARFQNSGQSCIAAKRFIVVDEVYDAFERRFVDAASSLSMGDPLDAKTQIGPLARVDLRDELADQVRRSALAGARILTGGEVPAGLGAFYPPTVLAGVEAGMAAWSEELFGPVATLIRVRDEVEAIRVANATEFGLSGAVWTRDLARGERIAAQQIESGAAFVNSMSKSDPRMPFGGIRHSGYGRELSIYGIREFVNIHAVWVEAPD